MKKLVVMATLLVAAASSYAVPEPLEITEDVYSVVINMKTTKPNVTYVNGQEFVYRSVTSKTLNGFTCVDIGNRFDEGNGIILGYNGEPLFTFDNIWHNVVRIGKNSTEIEADGAIWGGDVMIFMRGFGAYDVKNNRVSSINGSINAFLPSPELNGEPVYGYDLVDLYPVYDEEEDPTTIAFGTFSIKYSLEASKKEAAGDDEWFLRKMGIVMRPTS